MLRDRYIASLLLTATIFGAPQSIAASVDCNAYRITDQTLTPDTMGAFDFIETKVSPKILELTLVTARNTTLEEFLFADPDLVNRKMLWELCHALNNSSSPKDVAGDRLTKAKADLNQREASSFRGIDSTRPGRQTRNELRYALSNPTGARSQFSPSNTNHLINASFISPVVTEYAQSQYDADKFLREAPFHITEANKYFVIVSSVLERDKAIAEMKRLKKRTPDLEFEVYPPYQGNPNHAIMIATWVPCHIAKQARAIGRARIRKDSFLWRFPDGKQSCTSLR